MAEMNVSILVRLLDQVSGPFQRVTASAKQATSALDAASKKADALYQSAANIRQSAEGVSTFADKVGALVAGPLRLAAEFDESLRRAGARARATSEELTALSDAARSVGSTTEFSAQQAVQGLRTLTNAGFSATDSIALLSSSVTLAQASDIELGASTAMTAELLNAFRLRAADAARVTDVLQAASNMSSTSIVELGQALGQAAPASQVLGVSVETTTAMVSLLANAGYQGAEAGGALAAMMRSLLKPSALAKQALAAIKLPLMDKDTKQLKTVDVVLSEMATKLSKLSEGNQARVVQAVFGGSAPAAVALLDAGAGAITRVAGSLRDAAGAAGDMADRTGGDAKGATEELHNSIQTLQLTAGQALLPALGQLAESMTKVIGKMGEWTNAHPALTAGIMGGLASVYLFTKSLSGVLFLISTLKSTAGLGALAAGFAKYAGIVSSVAIPATLRFTAALLTNPIVLAAGAVGALAYGIYTLVDNAGGLDAAWERLMKVNGVAAIVLSPITMIVGAAKLLRDSWEPVTKWFGDVWDSIADGVGGAVREILKTFEPLFDHPVFQWLGSIGKTVGSELSQAVTNVKEIGQQVSGVFTSPANAENTTTVETRKIESITEMRSAAQQESERQTLGLGPLAAAQKQRVEGTIKVEVSGPGRVTSVRSVGGIDFDVRAGMSMVTR